MPQGSNMFYATDKLDFVNNVRNDGVDLSQVTLSTMVQRAQDFVYENNLYPQNEPDNDAVQEFIINENAGQPVYKARLYNGEVFDVPKETLDNYVVYNYLPKRFKTLKLKT